MKCDYHYRQRGAGRGVRVRVDHSLQCTAWLAESPLSTIMLPRLSTRNTFFGILNPSMENNVYWDDTS